MDTDVLIQTSQHRTLQDIVDTDGYIALRSIEEEVLLGLSVHNHVIATGGTAAACYHLAHQSGAEVVGYAFLMELGFLQGRTVLKEGIRVHSVLMG